MLFQFTYVVFTKNVTEKKNMKFILTDMYLFDGVDLLFSTNVVSQFIAIKLSSTSNLKLLLPRAV